MKEITIEIEDRLYKAYVAETEDEKINGLNNVQSLDLNEVMLFDYSSDPQDSLIFNTKDMSFPIDIIFVNDDDEVVAVEYGEPGSDDIIECIADGGEKLKYVIEANAGSGIEVGDDVDLDNEITEEEINKMYILGPDGTPQMELLGKERIVSRVETKQLIRKAKKAYKSKSDSDYKKLGKFMFKVLEKQDNQKPQYVTLKDNKKGE